MSISSIPILQRGDPRLAELCAPVGEVRDPAFQQQRDLLHWALSEFRREHGFGRAIAAPQIGVPRRFIALHLGPRRFTVVDPVIGHRSEATFSLWDDCLSFPDLLVRVRRHQSISLEYTDGDTGRRLAWADLDRAASELLQHEIDHLDGVLAVDRAEGEAAIVSRVDFEADRARYAAQVDQPPHF